MASSACHVLLCCSLICVAIGGVAVLASFSRPAFLRGGVRNALEARGMWTRPLVVTQHSVSAKPTANVQSVSDIARCAASLRPNRSKTLYNPWEGHHAKAPPAPGPYQIEMCDDPGEVGRVVAYVHVYKSAGSAIMGKLRNEYRTGEASSRRNCCFFASWSPPGPDGCSEGCDEKCFAAKLRAASASGTLFTYIRDPVERFLSGYIEVLHRCARAGDIGPGDCRELSKAFGQPVPVGNELFKSLLRNVVFDGKGQGARDVATVAKHVELRGYFNEHVLPQLDFFRVAQWAGADNLRFGLQGSINDDLPVYLGFHGRGLQARNRHSLAYFRDVFGSAEDGSVAAVVESKHLPNEATRALCRMYQADYTCLPYLQPPPECGAL